MEQRAMRYGHDAWTTYPPPDTNMAYTFVTPPATVTCSAVGQTMSFNAAQLLKG